MMDPILGRSIELILRVHQERQRAEGPRDDSELQSRELLQRREPITLHGIATVHFPPTPKWRWRSLYSKCSTRICSGHGKEKKIIH
jgi:hypothetical protein